ncbi:MAG: M16 family metallopeptidase [Sarcina sp.]
MKKITFENGVKLIYEYREISHSSFCIGLEAGAIMEGENNIGVAHALEHFLFKGTEELNEYEINEKIDRLMGFSNAMTNFPYVIYYGTAMNEDFKEAFDLYSDILLKPKFDENGFEEEISVIKQELLDWDEDLEQLCEDKLLKNIFKEDRIGTKIIGEIENINNITMKSLKDFYEKFYISDNIIISVVTSINFEEIKKIVYKNFGELKKANLIEKDEKTRSFNQGIYLENKGLNKVGKLEFLFDISKLTLDEMKALKLFNMYFGEGVSSLLYDEIRTNLGLAYEVYSEVKWEKNIKLFKIVVNTSKDFVDRAITAVEKLIDEVKKKDFNSEEINLLGKRYKMKSSLEIERSIVLANRMAINEILNGDGEIPIKDGSENAQFTGEFFKKIIEKVLVSPAIGKLI